MQALFLNLVHLAGVGTIVTLRGGEDILAACLSFKRDELEAVVFVQFCFSLWEVFLLHAVGNGLACLKI